MKNLLSMLTVLVAVLFTFSAVYAQDSLKVKKQNKNQNQHQFQEETKNKGEETAIQTKAKHSPGLVDENGDGLNDNAPDHDGDGIPNGQDPDYDGAKARKGNGAKGFVDENGDGINDNAYDSDGDGIPNGQDEDYVKPEDGTGRKNQYGKDSGKKEMKKTATGIDSGSDNSSGSESCDGTGPKGKTKGKNN
jgi:hypothetical protein